MKIKTILAAILLLMPLTTTQAQRKGRPTKQQKVEEPEEDPRIAQMLAATQQVVFVDSLIVDKDKFMSHIPLSRHIGKLTQTSGLGTFTNEMGDHRLATSPDSVITATDFIANQWTDPTPIEGIGKAPAINPFLMPDGITLYYAQKGEKSIGGYDIFVTRYDSDNARFLRPENIGMPFASEANDIFYAIDEFNQIGYFVTDRRQPEGKVCIYTFIPSDTRQAYNTEAYSDEQLRSLAAISRIADTWTDKESRKKALARLEKARTVDGKAQSDQQSAQGMSETEQMKHQAEVLSKALTVARNYYAKASEDERQQLRNEILNSEKQLETLQLEIRQKEKQTPYQD